MKLVMTLIATALVAGSAVAAPDGAKLYTEKTCNAVQSAERRRCTKNLRTLRLLKYASETVFTVFIARDAEPMGQRRCGVQTQQRNGTHQGQAAQPRRNKNERHT